MIVRCTDLYWMKRAEEEKKTQSARPAADGEVKL